MNIRLNKFISTSNKSTFLILSIFVVVCIFFSVIIPPFQSPDEFDHVKRAYLLSKGVIVLDKAKGELSGGMINTGLSHYMEAYNGLPFKPDRKLSSAEIAIAKNIKWTDISKYDFAGTTAFNFPMIYLPQAMGLLIGEKTGLSVDTSYRLARYLALTAITVILFFAFNIYPINPLMLALILMPMSIFQFSSASLDGIATALSILVIAAFLRISTERENTSKLLFYTLIISIILLTTSRVHLLPFFALGLGACLYIKKKWCFFVLAFALLSTFTWLVIVKKTAVDFAVDTGIPTSDIMLFYIKNPLKFFDVLYATLTNSVYAKFYLNSFVGVLGWLDTAFSPATYSKFLMVLSFIGILSISLKKITNDFIPRILLLFCSLASVVIIFFALLISWTHHPASVIEGVQGRYFLIPMIMIAYALSGNLMLYEGKPRKLALFFLTGIGLFTILGTSNLLLKRYYLIDQQPETISVAVKTDHAE